MRTPSRIDEEALALELLGDRVVIADPADERVLVQVGVVLGEPRHLDAGDDQEGAEDVKQPVELADQPAACEDHDRAQHDRADDAVQQHAALQLERHREEAEDHHPHEDVVDRQRLLDQVAGDEGGRLLVGDRTPERAVEIPPQPGGEQHRHGDPGERPACRLLQRHPVLLAATEGEQVDKQHRSHDGGKGRPHPPRSDRFHRALRRKQKRSVPDGHRPWRAAMHGPCPSGKVSLATNEWIRSLPPAPGDGLKTDLPY
jgi:hypothetical protein